MGDLRRLIAFDLDGTLIDSRRDLADAANELIAELGGPPLAEEAVGGMVGGGAARLVRRSLDAVGLAFTPEALARFLEIYDTRLLRHTRAYDGIAELLRAVHGRARLTVLTNKPVRPSEAILAGLGLRELFDQVIGGDGPHPRKPDPEGLRAMMAVAGADARGTLLVGDSAVDRETARHAPSRSCMVTYGIGTATLTGEVLDGCDWVVGDTAELARVLEQFIAA